MNPIHDVPPFPAIPLSLQQSDPTMSATTTDAIAHHASQLMDSLNRRSTALANDGNLNLAMRDAEVMQAIGPATSLGYLQAGSIYQQQGRHKEAALIYQKALDNVPASDPGYTELQVQHADASTAANKRVDFITRLPFDLVVSEIYPLLFYKYKLSPYTPCPYLYVSRTWRQRILHCNNLTFDLYGAARKPFRSSELAKFSRHVKSVEFEIVIGGDTIHDANAWAIRKADFSNLTHFAIRYLESNDDDLLFILQSIGRNLTHFRYYDESILDPPGVHLSRILQICPNLVSVSLNSSQVDFVSIQYPTITHFCLFIPDRVLPANTITNIISHLPSLVFLHLFPFPITQYLTTVNRHCPNLKVLPCGGVLLFDQDDYDQHLHGLQKFSFGYDSDMVPHDSDPLVWQLLANHQTLDHVVLNGGISDLRGLLDGRDMDPSLRFNRLERLEIIAANQALIDLATFIIRRSPHLSSIKLGFHELHSNAIFDAIQGLPNLGTFEADNVEAAATSISNLLQYHAQRGIDSSLKTFKVTFHPYGSTSRWGIAISNLDRLEKLVINATVSGARWQADYLSFLGIIGKGCPALKDLELNSKHSRVPEGSVFHFKHHPTLQCLRLRGSSIAESDVVCILSLPNLKHFIYNTPINEQLLELVQQHVRHVEQGPW